MRKLPIASDPHRGPAERNTTMNGKRFEDGSRGNTRGNSINGRANKDRRRIDAFARETAYANISTAQKLKRLPVGGAMRQRDRLKKQLHI